jgi:ferredoxin
MRVTVDQDLCVGAGQCVRAAERAFSQSEDDGLVVLLDANPSASAFREVALAASWCPTGAITVADDE